MCVLFSSLSVCISIILSTETKIKHRAHPLPFQPTRTCLPFLLQVQDDCLSCI